MEVDGATPGEAAGATLSEIAGGAPDDGTSASGGPAPDYGVPVPDEDSPGPDDEVPAALYGLPSFRRLPGLFMQAVLNLCTSAPRLSRSNFPRLSGANL